MKIINREAFLAIEGEVLFAKYAPCVFEELHIKLDNCGSNDFFATSLNSLDTRSSTDLVDKLDDAFINGTEVAINLESVGRDGCFDDDQLFAVWSTDDVETMIHRLSALLPADNIIRNRLSFR